MGDVGEAFEGWNDWKKELKEKRLSKANVSGWKKHTDYHYSLQKGDTRFNWWPSVHKLQVNNKMYYGSSQLQKIFSFYNIPWKQS